MKNFVVVLWVEDPFDASFDRFENVEVKANNKEEASRQVKELWRNGVVQCVVEGKIV